ncbi:MAG: hypothetical protein PVJ66_01610 [Gammaproteobacteria bacterium]|jgi:hypothetical protein
MVIIYDMPSGGIQSENPGVKTVSEHARIPEYRLALQPVTREPASRPATPSPCDEYMSLIRELLRDM